MTIFSKNLGGMASLPPPGYAYGVNPLKVWKKCVLQC